MDLKNVLDLHKKWLNAETGGKRADLTGADLTEANLTGAKLIGADLRSANLSGADLSDAKLIGAYLRRANLSEANLSGANLSGANLSGADLRSANLSGADLRSANLSGANLSGADLSVANLSEANLSGAAGLLNPSNWMSDNFQTDDLGYIVYKTFGYYSEPPTKWKIEKGSFVEEVVNRIPTNDCGCGVNFGTIGWIQKNIEDPIIWKCRIRWVDCVGIVVPYNTDGKARCGRLELLEKL